MINPSKLQPLFIFVSFFLTFSPTLYAQEETSEIPSEVLYRVYYELSHVRDTLNKQQPYREDMVLLLGENSSHFLSYDKLKQRLSKFNEIQQALNSSDEQLPRIQSSPGRIVTPVELLHQYHSEKFEVRGFLGAYLQYDDPVESIQWEVRSDSVKVISGLSCTKAVGNLRGREWHVWFTNEIPFSAGPWYLSGLPGLIVQAEDVTKQIRYDLLGFEDGTTVDTVLKEAMSLSNKEIREIKKSQFIKLKSQLIQDPSGFRKANSQFNMFVEDYGLLNGQSWSKKVKNPIDLSQ